jgi:multidrug efflux pump subunit AcrA (membrane-fusion protein)
MQVAEARAAQAKAKLEILELHLAQSDVRAPFDGVVVEGDLRERIGAPLKQGDALFRVARLDKMYAEALVREDDIRGVAPGASGQIAFASKPGSRFTVRVEQVEPMAVPRPEGNVFIVRCTLPAKNEAWWRPGMRGAAKIDAGRHAPLWIATHRTLDYLRLRWW